MNFSFDAREAENLSHKLREYFEEFTRGTRGAEPQKIYADVSYDELNYYVEVDLPGVSKEEISVDLIADTLLEIAGTRSRGLVEGVRVVEGERRFGPFRKQVRLPAEGQIDAEAVTAAFRDGVLRVTLPKKGAGPRRSVTIE
jgi:HSP20 family protein